MVIKVAWRNIWRNKKRSLILMAAVAIGLWSGIFLMAFYNGMLEQRINLAINRELSHLQLHHPEFPADHDIQFVLPNGHAQLSAITNDPATKAATGRIIIRGMIASANGSSGTTINAVMPFEEDQVTSLSKKITEGRYFQDDKTNEILVSEKTTNKLKLKLNKKAILTFQDKEGNLASAAFRICGVYKTFNTPYDESNVFVNIRGADSLAGIDGQLNEIAVLLQSNETIDDVQRQFADRWPEVLIQNWMQISPDMSLTVVAGDQMVLVFMSIILLALAFGIVNTMMMSILERTREIGMLLALGMNKLKVFTMILLETFFLILAGCPAGLLLALGTVLLTRRSGIDMEQLTGADVYNSFGFDPLIYPILRIDQLGTILLLIVVTAIVSALFPARKALSLKPAESIKK